MLNFCLLDLLCTILVPNLMIPLVWICMLGWIAHCISIQAIKVDRSLKIIILMTSMAECRLINTLLNFFQLRSSGLQTIAVNCSCLFLQMKNVCSSAVKLITIWFTEFRDIVVDHHTILGYRWDYYCPHAYNNFWKIINYFSINTLILVFMPRYLCCYAKVGFILAKWPSTSMTIIRMTDSW